MLIDNYKPTCVQTGTKYELAQIHDSPTEPLRHYIQRFSEVWITIPDISTPEAISIFVAGLQQERNADLRKERLRVQPRTMEGLFRIAQEWARVDDALQQFDDGRGPSHRNYRRDDDRDRDRRDYRRDDCRDDRRDERRDDHHGDDRPYKPRGRQDYNGDRRNRGNRNNNSVNAIKGQKRDIDDEYDEILCQDCPRHPNKGHTFGECNGFASIFSKGAYKR